MRRRKLRKAVVAGICSGLQVAVRFWRADSKRCTTSKSLRNNFDGYGDIKYSRLVEADGKIPVDILGTEILSRNLGFLIAFLGWEDPRVINLYFIWNADGGIQSTSGLDFHPKMGEKFSAQSTRTGTLLSWASLHIAGINSIFPSPRKWRIDIPFRKFGPLST